MYDYFVEINLYGGFPRYTDIFDDYDEAKDVFIKSKDIVDYFGGHVWLYSIDRNLVVKTIECY